jgi:hypothetical protein
MQGSVQFNVKLEQGTADLKQTTSWYATYKGTLSTARFRVELGPQSMPSNGPIAIGLGKGKFLSEANSDNVELIRALKKALQAKTVPTMLVRRKSLPFEYVVLAQGIHRSPDGQYDSQKKGDWIAMKLFFGDDAAEVFLNLNPASGVGEFSIKDPDYGNYVVRKLAQVL